MTDAFKATSKLDDAIGNWGQANTLYVVVLCRGQATDEIVFRTSTTNETRTSPSAWHQVMDLIQNE